MPQETDAEARLDLDEPLDEETLIQRYNEAVVARVLRDARRNVNVHTYFDEDATGVCIEEPGQEDDHLDEEEKCRGSEDAVEKCRECEAAQCRKCAKKRAQEERRPVSHNAWLRRSSLTAFLNFFE